VKTFIKGLRMPTGVGFLNGNLYVIDIDKLYEYPNAEANLDAAPQPKVVYDDMPPYIPHGWKYLIPDKEGWFYIPFGPPCNVCYAPTSVNQYRRSIRRPAWPSLSRSASATASAATSTHAPATCGSPRMRATGSATICRATSSTT
jgi:glucose/arabinose dehydrogenase